jgi:hypothetical protein
VPVFFGRVLAGLLEPTTGGSAAAGEWAEWVVGEAVLVHGEACAAGRLECGAPFTGGRASSTGVSGATGGAGAGVEGVAGVDGEAGGKVVGVAGGGVGGATVGEVGEAAVGEAGGVTAGVAVGGDGVVAMSVEVRSVAGLFVVVGEGSREERRVGL